MLKITDLSFSFGNRVILNSLDLELEQGKIYALMGANGAGKSTLFNVLTGFLKPQSGLIKLNNKVIFEDKTRKNLAPYLRNRAGIGRTFQDLRLIETLTVKENIELAFKSILSDKWYNALLPNKKIKEQELGLQQKVDDILAEFHLEEVKGNLASELSYGQQKLLTIACCVANDADLLALDEPVAGVNVIYREQLTEILRQLKQKGKTILLIEHNTEFIDQVADTIFFLANGHIKEYPDIAMMKQANEVIKAYM